ncbi:lactate utilization protein C [mine drainage metagenome]|uniref:Lactate utilization protein C n=1 Tax=mine drainage metagenome TaxID=410659 RepID=A0A1J5SA61_9ZZZZ
MANTAKENILKKIRQALAHPVPVPFPQSEGNDNLFQPAIKELEIEFAENFTGLLGRFSFCFDEQELVQQLNTLIAARKWENIYCVEDILKQNLSANGFANFNATDLKTCDASITSCELLIARTGSILMSSASESGRTTSVYAPVHICIAYTNQLVYDIKDGLKIVNEKYKNNLPSLITLATGPSRTADIEKTLVVGVHGPKEVFCFLVDKK